MGYDDFVTGRARAEAVSKTNGKLYHHRVQ